MIRQNIEKLKADSENCKNCQSNCPCKILNEYILKIGYDEFEKQFNNGLLPNNIRKIYENKFKK